MLELERLLERSRSCAGEAAAAERGIALRRRDDAGGSVWCAQADAERVLDVLLENALAYAPGGSTVTLAAAPGRIEVLDRGPGLSEDDERTIFERFHRGSAGRGGAPGSGLGPADRARAGPRLGRRGDPREPARAAAPSRRSLPEAPA